MTQHQLLTSKQAADAIHVSERTLRKLRKEGLIAYVAVTDRLVMYRPEDCEEYLASRIRRDQPCRPRPEQTRRSNRRARSGNVISFEQLAKKRGW